MTRLLERLANTDILQYPISVLHTGGNAVPDFQLQAGLRRIAVETAKLTSQNWEHATSLQRKLPAPPSHYADADLVHAEDFAIHLRDHCLAWPMFVKARLPAQCREWLVGWNRGDAVPGEMRRQMVETLNSIIDGPPIAEEPLLQSAGPPPELVRCEGFPSDEKARDRKTWLDDAFYEYLARPINGTLMDGAFMHDASRMSRAEIIDAGFYIPAMPIPPTTEERDAFWIKRFCAELRDKSGILSGGQFARGDEDWLLLWDRLGTPEWRLHQRAQDVSSVLQSSWAPSWFSRVFIQDDGFRWLLMFTAASFRTFPSETE